MDSRVTVRFYRVERKSKDQPQFGDCLAHLVGKEEDDLVADVGDIRMGIHYLKKEDGAITGDLVRHQKENLPTLLVKGKKPEKLPLPAEGSLGHHTAFRYDPATAMLAYQLSRTSVAMSRFNQYVAQLCGCDTFLLVPVFDPAEISSLAKMKPRTMWIKVAEPHDLEAIEDDQKELRDSLVTLKDFANGTYVKVQVGLGHYKGELEKGAVSGLISWLLEQRAKKRGKIRSLKVEGKSLMNDDDIPLDFLRAHLGESKKLSLDNLSPEDHYRERAEYLHEVMMRQSATLKQLTKDAG